MARGSLRRYDVQASVSLWLSLASVLGLFALAFLVNRNFNWDMKVVAFREDSPFKLVLVAVTAATMGLAAIGLIFGISSAGERRNEKPAYSWIGFFVGAGVLSVAVVLFSVFWLYKMEVPSP